MLTFPLFLAILFIGCQTYENKETGGESASFNLRLNDVSYYSNNIGEGGSKFNLMSGYVENKDQQKRQARKRSAKSKASKKVSAKKPKKPLYKDINKLREKYFKPPLQINKTLSLELQDYVKKFIKNDSGLKPMVPQPTDLYYYCFSNEKYDPIGYWSKDAGFFLTYDYIYKDLIDLFYTKLLWKSSTHIGCGVYGDEYGVATYCRITPRGNIKGEYKKNIFNSD
uniref:SCP domain-containing protein n=1 Tax=Strongyloides papillosus TaxID=174720 RepID=A0A0N5CAY9_STREA